MNGEPVQTAANSRGRRVLIGLAWGLVQLAILFALLFAGGVTAGYLPFAPTMAGFFLRCARGPRLARS
jgi:hypothetical protein